VEKKSGSDLGAILGKGKRNLSRGKQRPDGGSCSMTAFSFKRDLGGRCRLGEERALRGEGEKVRRKRKVSIFEQGKTKGAENGSGGDGDATIASGQS